MKLFLLIFISIIFPFKAFSLDRISLKETQTKVRLNGKNVLKTEYKVKFHNSELRMLTHKQPQSKTIINNKWADFFFGLKFGEPTGNERYRNGGWSPWNFLDINLKNGGKEIPLTKNYPVKFVFVHHSKMKNICLMSWDIPETDSRLNVIITEIANTPESLFININISNPKNISLNFVRFLCYPWETKGPKYRERWFKTASKTVAVSRKEKSFKPKNNWLAFYNKFSQTKGVCFIYAKHKKIQKLQIPKSSYAVVARYFPVSNISNLSFALGVNNILPATQAVKLYEKRTKKRVKNILSNKNLFTVNTDVEFRKIQKEIKLLLKRESISGKYQKELKILINKYNSRSDIYQKLKSISSLKKMKNQLFMDILKKY